MKSSMNRGAQWAALSATLLTMLSACGSGRLGISSSGGTQSQATLWAAQPLCVNANNAAVLACATIQLDITNNVAYVDITKLGFNPAQISYGIYARATNSSTFDQLNSQLTTPAGGTFTVSPGGSTQYIENYQEWIIALNANYDSTGALVAAGPLQGIIAARATIVWPELSQPNNGTGN